MGFYFILVLYLNIFPFCLATDSPFKLNLNDPYVRAGWQRLRQDAREQPVSKFFQKKQPQTTLQMRSADQNTFKILAYRYRRSLVQSVTFLCNMLLFMYGCGRNYVLSAAIMSVTISLAFVAQTAKSTTTTQPAVSTVHQTTKPTIPATLPVPAKPIIQNPGRIEDIQIVLLESRAQLFKSTRGFPRRDLIDDELVRLESSHPDVQGGFFLMKVKREGGIFSEFYFARWNDFQKQLLPQLLETFRAHNWSIAASFAREQFPSTTSLLCLRLAGRECRAAALEQWLTKMTNTALQQWLTKMMNIADDDALQTAINQQLDMFCAYLQEVYLVRFLQ